MIGALLLLFAMETDCPMHAAHMKAAASSVESRHDTFGFSHATTRHTFRILDDGGAIELRGDDAKDIEAIRAHLKEIAVAFTKNDFSKPQFVHEKTPDGVATMQRLSQDISYRYEELPNGARVRITTNSKNALQAVHAFLAFQQREHGRPPASPVQQ